MLMTYESTAGLTTVGFRIVNDDKTQDAALTTVGVTEISAGCYAVNLAATKAGKTIQWYEGASYVVSERISVEPDNAGITAAKTAAEAVRNAYVGSGDKQVRLVIKNTQGVAIGDAEVSVSSDATGDTVILGPVTTTAQGKTPILMLNAGTYYRWAAKAGENFSNPQSFVVA